MNITGQTIKAIRPMTQEEMNRPGWMGARPGIAIELSNGIILYPSRDEEGNGPGVLFAHDPKHGKEFIIG